MIQREIRELSEQYSIKCLENASLEERLEAQTKAVSENRKRVSELMGRSVAGSSVFQLFAPNTGTVAPRAHRARKA